MAWTEKYLNLGATNNGDGTASNDAASGGAAGAWNSWANAVTGLGTLSVQTRVNVKGTVTLGGNVTLNSVGTSITVPLWWRGYNTTPGDIDSDNTLTKPLTTCGSNAFSPTTQYQLFTGLAWTGTTTSGVLRPQAVHVWFHRCRLTNTNATATGYAAAPQSAGPIWFTACQLVATSSSSALNCSIATHVIGCSMRAGISGYTNTVGSNLVAFCAVDGATSHGLYFNGGVNNFVLCNSIYGTGGASSVDGIRFTAAGNMALANYVSGYSGTSANAINYTGTAGLASRLLANGFFNCTSGTSAGQIESLEFFQPGTAGLLASEAFTNAASHDLSIGTVAKALGFPGAFEGESYTGYLDLGAIQRQELAAGGGILINPGMAGGLR